MGAIGKIFEQKFKNKEMAIFTGLETEFLELSQYSTFNRLIIIGTFIKYHEDAGVLEMQDHAGRTFYLNEFRIELFWVKDSNFNMLEVIQSMIPTGKKWLKNKKDQDIM